MMRGSWLVGPAQRHVLSEGVDRPSSKGTAYTGGSLEKAYVSAVTVDLWHTLMYLPAEDEETYMAHQLAMGREVLAESPRLPGAPERTLEELGQAFEKEYTAAVEASFQGRTVTPAEQLSRAAHETGRSADPRDYLERLRGEIGRTHFRRAPGAIEFLRGLRKDGYRVAVISNTVGEPGAFLRPVLHTMQLDQYAETFVFSDEHPWTKPSPEIFRFALDRLATSPSLAVHVGDSASDIEGARRTGYRGAVLFTGLHAYGAQYRKLFLASESDPPEAPYQAATLREAGRLVRKLLAP